MYIWHYTYASVADGRACGTVVGKDSKKYRISGYSKA